jgi:hypothetical protein
VTSTRICAVCAATPPKHAHFKLDFSLAPESGASCRLTHNHGRELLEASGVQRVYEPPIRAWKDGPSGGPPAPLLGHTWVMRLPYRREKGPGRLTAWPGRGHGELRASRWPPW